MDKQDPIRALAGKCRTPKQIQRYLRSLPYNHETNRETARSAAEALRHGTAHCFEATFVAAAVLELHGYPPLIVSFESKDGLDHVLYVFKQRGRWGSVARSRDDGLHGRPPIFNSIRSLVWSYFDPYIDKTGRITGFRCVNLDETGADWRRSRKSVWKAERYLISVSHTPLPSSDRRFERVRRAYLRRGPMPRKSFWW